MVGELMALEPFIERPRLVVVPDTSAFIEVFSAGVNPAFQA
jgi:hypothetical protein